MGRFPPFDYHAIDNVSYMWIKRDVTQAIDSKDGNKVYIVSSDDPRLKFMIYEVKSNEGLQNSSLEDTCMEVL